MTLIELVVALTITGTAVAAGYAAFASLVDRRDVAAQSAAAIQRESAARALLTRWLQSARLTVQADSIQFRAIDGATRERQPDDDIIFFTTAPTPVARGGTVVRLFIDRDDETPERGLVAVLSDWKSARREILELDTSADGLDGEYLTGVFGQRQWLRSWISTSVLPFGARLTVHGTADSLSPLWRLPLTVSIEGSR